MFTIIATITILGLGFLAMEADHTDRLANQQQEWQALIDECDEVLAEVRNTKR